MSKKNSSNDQKNSSNEQKNSSNRPKKYFKMNPKDSSNEQLFFNSFELNIFVSFDFLDNINYWSNICMAHLIHVFAHINYFLLI